MMAKNDIRNDFSGRPLLGEHLKGPQVTRQCPLGSWRQSLSKVSPCPSPRPARGQAQSRDPVIRGA